MKNIYFMNKYLFNIIKLLIYFLYKNKKFLFNYK